MKIKRFKESEFETTFKKVIKATDNKCFLMYGTLLGCIRSGTFIPWDLDIDFGILEEDMNESYITKLRESGFDVKTKSWPKNIAVDKEKIGTLSKININLYNQKRKLIAPHVCLDVLTKGLYDYRYFITRSSWLMGFPDKLITPLSYTNFYGMKVRVPGKNKKLLKYMYGKNWNIEQKNRNYLNGGIIRKKGKYCSGWILSKNGKLKRNEHK